MTEQRDCQHGTDNMCVVDEAVKTRLTSREEEARLQKWPCLLRRLGMVKRVANIESKHALGAKWQGSDGEMTCRKRLTRWEWREQCEGGGGSRRREFRLQEHLLAAVEGEGSRDARGLEEVVGCC